MLFNTAKHPAISVLVLKWMMSLLFLISSFPVSANEVVKVNTDKKKLKGDGATAGQIIMANSVDHKIKAEWTELNITNAELADDAVSTSKILNSTIAGDDIAADTITARSIANGTMPSTLVVDTNGNGHFTSIQAAINALPPSTGGKIFINTGVYSETCTIFQSNVILEGCGPSSVITSSLNEATLFLYGQNITLRDLSIRSENNTAIDLEGAADYSKILNCTISGGTNGVVVSEANNVQITGNSISSALAESNAINVTPANDLLIQGNSIQTPSDGDSIGIRVSPDSLRCRIVANNIQFGDDHGIELQGFFASSASTYTSVIGNTIVGTGLYAILSEQSNVIISANFLDALIYGIFVSTFAVKNAVTGNITTDNIATSATTGREHTFFGNIASFIDIDTDDTTSQPGTANDNSLNDPKQMNVEF